MDDRQSDAGGPQSGFRDNATKRRIQWKQFYQTTESQSLCNHYTRSVTPISNQGKASSIFISLFAEHCLYNLQRPLKRQPLIPDTGLGQVYKAGYKEFMRAGSVDGRGFRWQLPTTMVEAKLAWSDQWYHSGVYTHYSCAQSSLYMYTFYFWLAFKGEWLEVCQLKAKLSSFETNEFNEYNHRNQSQVLLMSVFSKSHRLDWNIG